tara:strand:- start:247 stop:876 length:630 start_codon:yes stop_codon:yes gene_type:complete
MALRLLPFRQYDEQDVVNMFALATGEALANTTIDGDGSNGVFVKILSGDLNADPVAYATHSSLGDTSAPFLGGSDMYPANTALQVQAAGVGDSVLGLTLNQTAIADENGEKLLYNTTKKEELQAVLPGQTVPIATKGIFTLSANAINAGGTALAVGGGFEVGDTDGSIQGVADAMADASLGMVLATGSRASSGGLTDQFEGSYVVIKLG